MWFYCFLDLIEIFFNHLFDIKMFKRIYLFYHVEKFFYWLSSYTILFILSAAVSFRAFDANLLSLLILRPSKASQIFHH